MSVTVTLCDNRQVKLGRIAPKARPQCLNLAKYLNLDQMTMALPESVDWASKSMDSLNRVYLNDRYGDCVIAGKYHQVGVWSGNDTGVAVQGTDNEVYNSYQKICGPGDNGCVITSVLDYFRQNGLPFNGKIHKIDGYVQADWTNKTLVQVGILLFGGGTIGINLPQAWTCTNCTWDVTNSQIVGGHDVCIVGYDQKGVQIATWGGIVTITWNAFLSTRWIEELYFELAPDWYNQDNLAPNGIDVATLKKDLQMINGGNIPPIDPPAPVVLYKLFEGATLVGNASGYTTLPSAEVDAHLFANKDQVAVSIKDANGVVVETVQPVTPPVPHPNDTIVLNIPAVVIPSFKIPGFFGVTVPAITIPAHVATGVINSDSKFVVNEICHANDVVMNEMKVVDWGAIIQQLLPILMEIITGLLSKKSVEASAIDWGAIIQQLLPIILQIIQGLLNKN